MSFSILGGADVLVEVEVFVLYCCTSQTIVEGINKKNNFCGARIITDEMRGNFVLIMNCRVNAYGMPIGGTYCMNTK